MKNIRIFLSENFPVLVVKFSVYLNRRVFVMFPRKKMALTFHTNFLPSYGDSLHDELSKRIF